jgi:RNA polymerase sigma-70 factor (ECF subfamily)
MDFVWRSLLRLGVSAADCDDGCQRVWLVVANKAATIEPDKVKSFIFSVVLRVASDMRRMEFDERSPPPGTSSGVIDAEAVLEQQRGWRLLDRVLSGMSWELRTVFVMYELEGMSSVEIAEAIGARRGTVASRLRLAREAFQRGVRHYQARPQAGTNLARRKPWWSA